MRHAVTGSVLNFAAVFTAAPAALLVVSASAGFRIEAASDAYLEATMTRRDDIVGRPLFEVFPDNPADSSATGTRNLGASFERVIASGAPDAMHLQRYDIPRRRRVVREFEERYWMPRNAPVVENGGPVTRIVHRVDDVTATMRRGPSDAWIATRRRVSIASTRDLPSLREAIRAACDGCSLDDSAVMDLLVAGSELASNMVVHAGGGDVEIESIGVGLPRGVRLRFKDDGPGISNLENALEGGKSTAGTLGLGLSGSRNLVDQLAVESGRTGTTVTVTKWSREKRRGG